LTARFSGDKIDWILWSANSRAFNFFDFLKGSVMGHFVELKATDGLTCPAYLAQPEGKAKGAVVVLQEIFGVNAHIQAVADGYAREGYLSLAPCTFQRVKPGVELGYTQEDMNAGFALKAAVEALPEPGVMQDIQAAIDYAASAGAVAVIGFCWGGLLTWRSACMLRGIRAAVPYYGGGITTDDEMSRLPKCSVLAHFADQDHWIPVSGVEAFKSAHPEVQVHVYAADHGFNCDHRGAFNAPAAKLAHERTLAFLAKQLVI
jgi:carboxymethylenebutenolidase